jgi:hypothetical protein
MALRSMQRPITLSTAAGCRAARDRVHFSSCPHDFLAKFVPSGIRATSFLFNSQLRLVFHFQARPTSRLLIVHYDPTPSLNSQSAFDQAHQLPAKDKFNTIFLTVTPTLAQQRHPINGQALTLFTHALCG